MTDLAAKGGHDTLDVSMVRLLPAASLHRHRLPQFLMDVLRRSDVCQRAAGAGLIISHKGRLARMSCSVHLKECYACDL